MQLSHPFLKFPFQFDVEKLRAEVEALPEGSWREHQEGFGGNSALTLITTNGTDNDETDSPMLPTEHLKRSSYITQVLARFRTLHGRARLMRLAPRSGVPPHSDKSYYWRARARVHIPITTHPDIKFRCGDETIHMAAGEAWTFDNWRPHQVINTTDTWRIHLTFDTFGSGHFWNLARPHHENRPTHFIPFQGNAVAKLSYETYPGDLVMPPGELDYEFARLASDVMADRENDPAAVTQFLGVLNDLRREWRLLWHAKGPVEKTVPLFKTLLVDAARAYKEKLPEGLTLASNGMSAGDILVADFVSMVKSTANDTALKYDKAAMKPPEFRRPIFIVAAPRSGSTMLFEALAANEQLWTIGGEGHEHIEHIATLNPENREFDSNRLTAADASEGVGEKLRAAYATSLRMADGVTHYTDMGSARPNTVRLLEKTPKNALRIPFLKAIFPDAKFIFLHREAGPNISAIMDAWESGRFITYRNLPQWKGLPWSLLLIPGWRDLAGADLAKIAFRQWQDTNAMIRHDLNDLPALDHCSVSYEQFLDDPAKALEELCAFAEVPFGPATRAIANAPLRWSRYTLTAPDKDKWRKNEAVIGPLLSGV